MNRQTVFCHECSNTFEVDIDLSLNGNHVFKCPHCQHEHCRVVKDGVITDIRWDSRNGNTYNISVFSNNRTFSSIYCSGSQDSWLDHSWRNMSTTDSAVSSYYTSGTYGA